MTKVVRGRTDATFLARQPHINPEPTKTGHDFCIKIIYNVLIATNEEIIVHAGSDLQPGDLPVNLCK